MYVMYVCTYVCMHVCMNIYVCMFVWAICHGLHARMYEHICVHVCVGNMPWMQTDKERGEASRQTGGLLEMHEPAPVLPAPRAKVRERSCREAHSLPRGYSAPRGRSQARPPHQRPSSPRQRPHAPILPAIAAPAHTPASSSAPARSRTRQGGLGTVGASSSPARASCP
jgi:hypothetical protein